MYSYSTLRVHDRMCLSVVGVGPMGHDLHDGDLARYLFVITITCFFSEIHVICVSRQPLGPMNLQNANNPPPKPSFPQLNDIVLFQHPSASARVNTEYILVTWYSSKRFQHDLGRLRSGLLLERKMSNAIKCDHDADNWRIISLWFSQSTSRLIKHASIDVRNTSSSTLRATLRVLVLQEIYATDSKAI